MTPEFCARLFRLGSEELGCLTEHGMSDAKVRVIPLELQRLFARLLMLNTCAVSTVDLTTSFGWNNHEEREQHDIQELNRILFRWQQFCFDLTVTWNSRLFIVILISLELAVWLKWQRLPVSYMAQNLLLVLEKWQKTVSHCIGLAWVSITYDWLPDVCDTSSLYNCWSLGLCDLLTLLQ